MGSSKGSGFQEITDPNRVQEIDKAFERMAESAQQQIDQTSGIVNPIIPSQSEPTAIEVNAMKTPNLNGTAGDHSSTGC